MTEVTVHTTRKGQVIHLPPNSAFPANVRRVEVLKLGPARLLAPVDATWDAFLDGPPVSDDFMNDRSPSTR